MVKPELHGDRTGLRIEIAAVALKTKILPTFAPSRNQVSSNFSKDPVSIGSSDHWM